MSVSKFKAGDVVRLKGGTIFMTVRPSGVSSSWVWCDWQDTMGTARREFYSEDQLELIDVIDTSEDSDDAEQQT